MTAHNMAKEDPQGLELPVTSDCSSSITQVPTEAQESSTELSLPPGTPNTLVQEDSHVSDLESLKAPEEDQYQRFSPARKLLIVSTLAFCALLAPISSTAIMAAVPELAKTYQTTPEVINASTAVYLTSMGVAALFWGPLSQVYGRRPVSRLTFHVRHHHVLIAPLHRSSSQAASCSSSSPSQPPSLQLSPPTSSSVPSQPSRAHPSWSSAAPPSATSTRQTPAPRPSAGSYLVAWSDQPLVHS